jgi:LacI family transcriptional regulator
MKPPFPIKEIALQSGLSPATIDRVLHGRPGVRRTTLARVQSAIRELEHIYAQSAVPAKRLTIDVVMDAPDRFTSAVRAALAAELPGIRPAAFSARYHLAEDMGADWLASIIAAIRKRGSHGVLLKVPSIAGNQALAEGLMANRIPVVTLVTDLPQQCRTAYVGMDNHQAGATAAWLLGKMVEPVGGSILVTLSSASFAGEDEREQGFRAVLATHFPTLRAVTVAEGQGKDHTTGQLVSQALEHDRSINAVYSAGGGNRAILRAFTSARRKCIAFAAHDLDSDNRALLADHKLTFVIHHDLRRDARAACQHFLRYHRMLAPQFEIAPSQIVVATPMTMF